MSDLETFYANPRVTPPTLLEDNDYRKFYSDCMCRVCQRKTVAGEGDVKSVFEDYNIIVPSKTRRLRRHMYLLCPSEIPAFVFKSRAWRKFCCCDKVYLLSRGMPRY